MLALNLIVGPGEAIELNRCLESVCVEGFLDEIVIVTTSHDEAVRKVAEKFTKKIFYFQWIKDFSAARNFALSKTKSPCVLWLDSDDVIDKLSQSRLLEMKGYIGKDNHDIYLIPYHLDYNKRGEFQQFLPRDRIFKRQRSIKWEKRVHEQLKKNLKKHTFANFNGIYVEHRNVKNPEVSLRRNIKILKEEYEKNPDDIHYAFYYARDLFLIEEFDKSIQIFDYIIKKRVGSIGNLFTAAFQIASYYTYDKGCLKTETIDIGENYARIALSFSDRYAEPYVLLGDIYHFKGMIKEAIRFYNIAMSKGLDGMGLQQIPFYEEIPAERLSRIYFESNEYAGAEQALYYNKLALKHDPVNEELLKNRKRMLLELTK